MVVCPILFEACEWTKKIVNQFTMVELMVHDRWVLKKWRLGDQSQYHYLTCDKNTKTELTQHSHTISGQEEHLRDDLMAKTGPELPGSELK
ncbi:hypothetical protein L596_025932 [Steinernema carpocapsae]|uniref:Uncharacterized protein n=1 Tax=Steinernema carpocapsae TaxID=34508 RepID=A0A4U5M980_STECR|nr:hypothetical protein L596_025932 [Steinernema carpocapsae]